MQSNGKKGKSKLNAIPKKDWVALVAERKR